MAEQEERHPGLLGGGEHDQPVEIICGVVDTVDHGPRPLGAAVAAVVERVHGVALIHESHRDVCVATAVLTCPVGDHDHRAGRPIGQPRLAVEPDASHAFELALAVIHTVACSWAQGTTTASSCGESRATTYSAGSLSERFSSTCVSRGGT